MSSDGMPHRGDQEAGRLKRRLDAALVEVARRAFMNSVEIDPQLVGMPAPKRTGQSIADQRTPQPSRDRRAVRSPIGNERVVIELGHQSRPVDESYCRSSALVPSMPSGFEHIEIEMPGIDLFPGDGLADPLQAAQRIDRIEF